MKACFLGSNLTVPVSDGKLNLGTWQGVWLCEHRDRAGSRKVFIVDVGVVVVYYGRRKSSLIF